MEKNLELSKGEDGLRKNITILKSPKNEADSYPQIKNMKTDTERRIPYNCPVCAKDYSSFKSLKNHWRHHSKYRPRNIRVGDVDFECPLCRKSFMTHHSLTRHMLIHEDEEDFVCAVCSKSFTRILYLKRHQRLTHMDIKVRDYRRSKPFECNFCTKRYMYEHTLIVHKIAHLAANKSEECRGDNKKFRQAVHSLIHGKCETLTILGNELRSEEEDKVDSKRNLNLDEDRSFQNLPAIANNSTSVCVKEEVELNDLDLCDEIGFEDSELEFEDNKVELKEPIKLMKRKTNCDVSWEHNTIYTKTLCEIKKELPD